MIIKFKKMSNYHHLSQNQEAEPEKIYFLLNKNIEARNLFKGDTNLNKSKERIYYINSKIDNHLMSRVKENEIGTNGPKMLTMNFPPGFMISGNSNNSRKNVSHEKNLYMEKNMANNMELNNLGSDNEQIFSNTAKKEFQDYNYNNDYKDNKINIFALKQKVKVFNQKKKEKIKNLEKHNILYKESFPYGTGFNSLGNSEYNKIELNSRKFPKEKKNNYEIIVNNIKTEGSDYKNNSKGGTAPTNFKSILNYNNPFNMIINNNKGNKNKSNLYSNLDIIDNNNNSYYYKYFRKNINGNSSGTNKLVFNPSSITNQRMIKKNSDSELIPSSIEQYIKNIKYYSNQNQSENHSKYSSSNDSKTQNRENFQTFNQIKYIKTIKPNESIMNELQSNRKNNSNSEKECNKNILKYIDNKRRKIDKVNIGITYKIYNGYKYYFDIQNGQIYILKEVPFNAGKNIIHSIEEWIKKYEKDEFYLKIYGHENNNNLKETIWIIQYPKGGESLYDVINSVGFYDQNILFNIVTKIYKNIIKLKEYDKYLNVPFCLCDIYINVNEHIKLIPPLIRNINLNVNNKKKNNDKNTLCKCKKHILIFQKIFNVNKDFISFFCLGFLIIQIITQNLIFKLNSFKNLLKNIKNNPSKNSINNDSSIKKCCLAHLLLDNENQRLNGKDFLLFSQFLNLYPKTLLDFLHKCTSFENKIPSSDSEFLNLYDTDKNLNLSYKEIIGITKLTKNKYIQLEDFLNNFEFNCKKMNLNINKDEYIGKLNSHKVSNLLSRVFDIDKELLLNKFNQKIEKINYYMKNKEKNEKKENCFYEDINNINFSELFIGYDKRKDDEKYYI